MSYLLDTNVVSEARRKTPDSGVMEWRSAHIRRNPNQRPKNERDQQTLHIRSPSPRRPETQSRFK